MSFKDRWNPKIMDEVLAEQYEEHMTKLADWLKQYNRLVGLALLITFVYSVSEYNYLFALISGCTLHLQIFINYTVRTSLNLPLWKKTEKQKTTETGSEKTQA